MKTIALCFNTPRMENVAWNNWSYGKEFPGAGWMKWVPILSGLDLVTAIDGKNCIENGIDPKSVVVVQEENNEYGQELVKRGADPRVLMCLESPIFASGFYDHIPTNFKHRLLFDGGTEHVYFPSFDDEDLKDPVPWNDRKFLCMVTSNKHYSWFVNRNYITPALSKALETQLHDYRYQAIQYFINKPDFDLYGRGWGRGDIQNGEIGGRECDDKLATIRNYKFCLCFENGSYPGYVTEKIIDCLVAGVIPVYSGAPDVDDYFPSSAIVHSFIYADFRTLEDDLRCMDPIYCEAMIAAGQEWLRSPKGQRYNNRVFAKRILEMCE